MTKIEYSEFKKNPLMYLLFLGIIGTVIVSKLLLTEKDNSKEEVKAIAKDKIEFVIGVLNDEKTARIKADSTNHALYEALGARKIIDTLNRK
jgi:hypothetical protein